MEECVKLENAIDVIGDGLNIYYEITLLDEDDNSEKIFTLRRH